MNTSTVRKLAPFSIGERVRMSPSNRSLEGRLRFSARFKPKVDLNVRRTPAPVVDISERKSRGGIKLLVMALALYAAGCDQAKQKEVENQTQVPVPSVNEPDINSPTLGEAVENLDGSLAGNKESVLPLAAVNQNEEAIWYAGLADNTDILFAATRQLGHLISGKTRIYLKALNIEFIRSWMNHSKHSWILSDEDMVINEVILNRVMLSEDGRPLAIVVYPKEDWNGAMRPDNLWGSSYSYVNELREKGYRVLYYEARTETDLYDAIREGGTSQKISVLLIAGHGDSETIDFGGNYRLRREVYYLGLNDMNEMRKLAGLMAEDCVVILESCSTGAGRNNIARALGRALPGCSIFAPKFDCAGFGFRYDENNRVSGAAHCCQIALPGDSWQFSCEERFTTVVNRR